MNANDIRYLATSVASLEAQMAVVKRFAERNFLRLNVEKYEIVMLSRDQRITIPDCEVDGVVVTSKRCREMSSVLVEGGSAGNTRMLNSG